MAVRYSNPFTRYLDDNFVGIPGAELWFYEPGQTTTLKDTFSNELGTIANTNPVVCDAFGVIPDIFLDGTYGLELRLSPEISGEKGVLINSADPVSGESSTGQFTDWDDTVSFSIGDIRRADDGCYYNSIANNNLNFNPTNEGNPTKWEKLVINGVWNPNITYEIDDTAYRNGLLFTSKTATNLNNTPESTPTNWKPGVKFNIPLAQAFASSL